MENVRIFSNAESIIAHSSELEEQLGDIAFERITVPARSKLARHRETGDHRITQTKGAVDHFVNLEGVAAMAVEIGHHNVRTGKFTPGIHVLGSTVFQAEVAGAGD
jgi:hypothetical protein